MGRALVAAGLAVTAAQAGCGGKVVYEEGSGGAGGAPSTGTTTTTTTAATTSATTSSVSTATSVTSSSVTTTSVTTTSSTGVGGAPPIPALVEVDLGEVPVDVPVVFEAPPGILGFTAVATPVSASPFEVVGISRIKPPAGAPVVDDFQIPGTAAGYYNFGIAAASVPQTDDFAAMPVMPGPWEITLGDAFGSGEKTQHLSVWYRQTVDAKFHGGVVDVNVFIAGGVVTKAYAQDAIEAAFNGFAGLSLGDVTFTDIGPEWSDIDGTSFYQVLELTAGAAGKPALNVIAVAALTGELEGAAGVTPAAPADGLDHGTHLSGIVVTLYEDELIDTLILRHEGGHFAGLFHTSEFEPGYGDRLGDTPFCADVQATFEGCPDYDNLMFPTGGDLTLTLSQEQLRVIEGSTFYRGVVETNGAPAVPLPMVLGGGPSGSSGVPGPMVGGPTIPAFAGHDWSHGLSASATAFLGGLWCPGDARARAPSPYATLAALGGSDATRLVAIGTDPQAPAYVRRRALAAAGHSAPAAREVARIAAVAEDEGASRIVRIGAIQGVAAASKPAALALAGRLAASQDAIVREVASSAAH